MQQRDRPQALERAATVIATEAVIVGAGPAGLAVAACLQQVGVPCLILERSDRIGAAWHRHYARLHLHTDKARSALPYFPFPKAYPNYPSRLQLIAYLEAYARHFRLQPRFGQHVIAAYQQDGQWHTRTEDSHYVSRYLIIATGYNGQPYLPTWPGQATFGGEIVHSSAYQRGARYRGRRVLVVGFGNSGGEIAIDLWEHGATPSLAVRSPVNILPRDLCGLPILAIAIPMSKLPPRLADALTAPILRLVFGDLAQLGLRKAAYGPFTQIRTQARIPLIDVGTVDLIRQGQVAVYPGIARFTERGVVFTDGQQQPFDAVILATGYCPAVAAFLEPAALVCDEQGKPRCSGREADIAGLYFCGFYVSPTGVLRECALEAQQIAQAIARQAARGSPASRP